MRAQSVGIVGLEIYFPRNYVDQSELEQYDEVPKGKYTIGLGQEYLSFTQSNEDVNSLALSVTKSLLEKYNIKPSQIGRLEVGTETFLDKSKSTKTVLMDLFDSNDIEGVTNVNACYGGTNALFNTINWMQSEVWDGRLGLVVCSDVAVYAKGSARPTGGAGAVAILIGPNAPIVMEVVRATFIKNEYDFYKPDPHSEYPVVDGQLSIKTYLNAIEQCFKLFKHKYQQRYGEDFTVDKANYFCFHSPFYKMVLKSFAHLVRLDQPQLDPQQLQHLTENWWKERVYPSTLAGRQLGNIYTGSLYAALISLISNVELQDKNVLMFSYGSGLASSMFMFRVKASTAHIAQKIHLHERLASRIKFAPPEYDKIMAEKEKKFGQLIVGAVPTDLSQLFNGAYYVQNVDNKWRRFYARKGNPLIEKNHSSALAQKNQYNKLWAGFYKKTVQQRLDQLEADIHPLRTGGLSLQTADLMVENCIGMISVPVGLGLNFLINDKYYTIPMAIEEPSVIAAASSLAKLVADFGEGFHAYSSRPIMMGQIQLIDVGDQERVKCIIDQHSKKIIELGNEMAVSMIKRGGGVERVDARPLPNKQMSIDIYVNVCESMGANLVNTIVEHVTPYVQRITGCQTGIRILTNYCLERRASVSFSVPVEKMGWKGMSGSEVSRLILHAQQFAEGDVYRAVTNNKGILNGIQAVALATGQDCRAINASLHAYACRSGSYKPLAQYSVENGQFKGTLSVPISVATKGGAVQSNAAYRSSLQLLNDPDAQTLAEIMVSVGLANNLAALRALCVEGIQKGHMNLHARNLAIASGVPTELVDEAVRFMKNRGRFRKETADEYLLAYDIYKEVRLNVEGKRRVVLSTFSGEFQIPGINDRVDLHVVFDCGSDEPIHVSFSNQDDGQKLRAQIFGAKGYEWLQNLFTVLQQVRLDYELEEQPLPTKQLSYKLKILSILINLLSYNMISLDYNKSKAVISEINKLKGNDQIGDLHLSSEDISIKYGLNLLCELVRIFKYNIQQHVLDSSLSVLLLEELMNIINSHLKTFELWEAVKSGHFDIEQFWNSRKKRLSCTMMLLCDALNLKPKNLNAQTLQTIISLGDIYEVEITIARDSSKWKRSNIFVDPNVYTYWLLLNNNLVHGDQHNIMLSFLNESVQLLESRRSSLEPQLSPQMKHLSGRATKVVNEYYKTIKPKL